MITIKVKSPYYDDTGLHRAGEIFKVAKIDPMLHEEVKEEKAEKPAKKTKAEK